MQNVKVYRYSQPEADSHGFGGWVEPADESWIIYLDADGRPTHYYGQRETGGGVIDESFINLKD